jgi:hypothetical protein
MILHTVLNNKKEIYSDWLQDVIVNLNDPTFKIPATYNYEILEVTEKYIARPDLLSLDIYGDTLYSDLLCKINGISNPFELNVGMILVIPSPDNIMDFMKTPSISECDTTISDNNNSVVPIAKQKSAKRKANESVVGDSRFKIDKTKGIVIY